jgi:hypothetical protein
MRSGTTRCSPAAQSLDPVDLDRVGASPAIFAPMAVRQAGEVDDLRFACRIFDHGASIRERAAIMRFSVPVTVTVSCTMRAPERRPAFA